MLLYNTHLHIHTIYMYGVHTKTIFHIYSCGPDNVNVEDSSSMTPLMLATMNRHAEVMYSVTKQ